jgi:hypothetical protein
MRDRSRHTRWLARTRDRIIFALPPAVIEHPFEIFLAFLCMVAGIPLLLAGPESTPNSIDDLLPVWLVYAWAVALIAGGVCVLLGKFLHWLHVERAGMALLAAGSFVYFLAITVSEVGVFGDGSGLFAAFLNLAFALASAVRYGVIGLTVERIRESLK